MSNTIRRRGAARRGKQPQRRLGFESLERRMLLAGDVYLINFQFDEATIPARHLRDAGAVFGDRGNGFSYGWSTDHSDVSRERSVHPDQRFDTLIHFHAGAQWEFALPNGLYEVTIAVGDPANNDGVHTVNAEGVNYWNAVADGDAPLVMTKQIAVSDGRLTLDQGAAADKATRIDYVYIVGLPSGPNAAPSAPAVTEPATNGQQVNPFDVHMESVGFADADGNLHKSTDWEIWTVGPGAEPVWQTLGIEGLEKVHTHQGDGIFINSRAGQISLAANADHELRVRFRDDAGSVSSYSVRTFHTTEATSAVPLELLDVLTAPAPTWDSVFGAPIELPGPSGILSPGDFIIPIDADGVSNSPGNEEAANAIDGATATKYLNFGEVNSGFIVTTSLPSSVVNSFRITTANDAEPRDPTAWQLYGTNETIVSAAHSTGTAESWTLIASGSVALPSARDTLGPVVNVTNATAYSSYKMIFTGVKDEAEANSMQFAEIAFFGDLPAGTAASLQLEAAGTGSPFLQIVASDAVGNTVNHFAALANQAALRLVVQAGSKNLNVGESDLAFSNQAGDSHTVFLPAINLAAGQRLDLWVTEDGSTYYGTALQTAPDFTLLARASEETQNNPFVALQPGYVVEEVGSGYRLPVNIAFVPNPGPNPTDPLYYVTELYGSIQVVTRNGAKQTFATGLLDYNPQGPISGTGEQGLTGLAVQRDEADPSIYHLYVGMLWDNGSPPGGLTHYPKVERLDSASGGLTMQSRTVLLNMQPETQGQSHQISNISIGPDGKLYVHNGDGFNTGTAQNLDQFRGKILRMNLDGTAPSDNPFYNGGAITARDYVYAYGVRNPFGGAWRAADGKHYEVENGPSVDRLAQINAGVNYGWNGSDASMAINAIYNWNPAHAPVNITFVQNETFGGSRFPPSKRDHAFVSESGPTYAGGPQARGKRVVEFDLDAGGALESGPTTLVEYRGTGQGSVVGLAAGPDGLYFTEMYEDTGANGPTAAGARIFRIRYVGQLPGDYDYNNSVAGNDFLAWQRTLGSVTNLAADGNQNGAVDAPDLAAWQGNYGVGPATAAAVVAEVQALAPASDGEPLDASPLVDLAKSGTPASRESAPSGALAARGTGRSRDARVNVAPHSNFEIHDRGLLLLLQRDNTVDSVAPLREPGSLDFGDLFGECGLDENTVAARRARMIDR